MALVPTVIDPDRCPYCPHTWHGLLCKDRVLLGHPACPCKGSLTPSELEDLLNTDV